MRRIGKIDELSRRYDCGSLFSGNRGVPPHCDTGGVLFFLPLLAGFSAGLTFISGGQPGGGSGAGFRGDGSHRLQLPLEHPGAKGAGKTGGAGMVS